GSCRAGEPGALATGAAMDVSSLSSSWKGGTNGGAGRIAPGRLFLKDNPPAFFKQENPLNDLKAHEAWEGRSHALPGGRDTTRLRHRPGGREPPRRRSEPRLPRRTTPRAAWQTPRPAAIGVRALVPRAGERQPGHEPAQCAPGSPGLLDTGLPGA